MEQRIQRYLGTKTALSAVTGALVAGGGMRQAGVIAAAALVALADRDRLEGMIPPQSWTS